MTDLVSIQTEMSNNKRINIPINYRITFNIKRTQCSVTERAVSSVRNRREREREKGEVRGEKLLLDV